jgi:hypothetical protein
VLLRQTKSSYSLRRVCEWKKENKSVLFFFSSPERQQADFTAAEDLKRCVKTRQRGRASEREREGERRERERERERERAREREREREGER